MHEWSGRTIRTFFSSSPHRDFDNWDKRGGASRGSASLDSLFFMMGLSVNKALPCASGAEAGDGRVRWPDAVLRNCDLKSAFAIEARSAV